MKRILPLLFILLTSAFSIAHATDAQHRLVVLVNEKCPLISINAKQLRRTYMGIPLIVDEQTLNPLLLSSNAELTEHFMQKVMFMSASAYDRMTTDNNFRNGRPAPRRFKTLTEVETYLKSHTDSLIVLWYEDAINITGGRIVEF